MRSSYIQHKYGDVFTSLVKSFQPKTAVEIGVLDGYSLCAIAEGLKFNGSGHVDAYDLFEDYQYNHGVKADVQKRLLDCGLDSYVSLHKEDAFNVSQKYTDKSVHFVHIDISNNGDTIHRMMDLWDSKLPYGGLICFEGGTVERDNIDWMKKYQKPSIKQAVESNAVLNSKYVYCTYLDFPGLTVCLKKKD